MSKNNQESSGEQISSQSKYIWKHTKYDGLQPITNFIKGVQENDPLKMKAESKKAVNVNSTKITSFSNGKQEDTIIKHSKLRGDPKSSE